MINKELKKYIEENILPEYKNTDKGHDLNHIKYVIKRSIKFSKNEKNINNNMVYTIASYHDIGHKKDPKNHEKVSAEILEKDKNLRLFFSEEEIRIMKEAVEDHRASSKEKPRNIYGKIVSSADRNTDVNSIIKRTYEYRIKNYNKTSLQELIEESYNHIKDKFGNKGYATEKMYYEDKEYEKFLKEIDILINDKEKFISEYIKINEIKE